LLDLVGGAPGPLRLLDRLPLPWLLAGGAVVGLVAGAVLAAKIVGETGVVEIAEQGVTVVRGGSRAFAARERIAGLHTDGSDLVLRGHRGPEFLRRECDVGARRLVAACRDAGYAWLGSREPGEHRFRAWGDGAADLPAAVHDLPRERERALRDGRAGAAAELRDHVQQLRFVVRDRGSPEQQWRRGKPVTGDARVG